MSIKAAIPGWGIVAAFMLALAAPAWAADLVRASSAPPSELQRALWDDATFDIHLRNYLLDRYEAGEIEPAAWALGGWLGYQTGWIGDVLQLGAVGYTSQPLWAPADRGGTLLLRPDQQGFTVLGQAYAALRYEGQTLTVYRQLVDQPEVNPQDDRMAPNTFEGATMQGTVGPVRYFGGVLTAMKTRDSGSFVNIAGAAGVSRNEVMYLGGLDYAPADGLEVRSSLYAVPDLLVSSYSDAAWRAGLGQDARVQLAGQFMVQSAIGDALLTGHGFEAWIAGIKGDLTYRGLTLTAGYTANGTNDSWEAPYGTWPGYTNMLVHPFDRAGEQALLLGAAYDFAGLGAPGLSVSASAAIDTQIDSSLAKRDEYDFAAGYRLDALNGVQSWLSPLWLNTSFSLVDTCNTDGTHDQLRDFRIILNYDVKLSGSEI